MNILKSFVAPIQARVLEKHRCPACTRPLDRIRKREPLTTETELVKCECGRQYVYNRTHRRYRRAVNDDLI